MPNIKLSTRCENESSGICGQGSPWSDCAFAQSDQGLHSPLTDSLGTIECRAKVRMTLFTCAGWSEYAHFACVRRHFFAWRGQNHAYLLNIFQLFIVAYNTLLCCSDFISLQSRLEFKVRKCATWCVCLCWGFTAHSTQWGHVERVSLPNHSFTGQA